MKIKKIGVLTSGGDAPGMNSAIYGIYSACHEKNIKLQETPKKAYTQIEIPDDDANWDDPAEVFERQHAEDIANEEGGDEDEED